MKAVILVNAHGGSAGSDPRERVVMALAKAGIAGDVELVAGAHLAVRAAAAVATGAKLVIASGGDGTISAVAGALAGSETVLGVLPSGTLNHFARDLGIPLVLDEAAALIAAGHQRRIDVARVNERIFINNSSVGLYSLLVDNRDEGQRRWGWSKQRALLPAAVRTLARMHHFRLRLTSAGRDATIDTPLLFVGNNDYATALPAAGRRASMQDGKLSVMVLRRTGRVGLFAVIARALVGRSRAADMIRIDTATELMVESHRPSLLVAFDGETAMMATPLHYSISPAALRVMTPR